MTVDNQHSVLLDNVYTLIRKKVDKTQAQLVEQFARILFNNISRDDLENRVDSDLYGACLSLWNEFSDYHDSEPFIRVFNPEISKHGWQSSHTIIEIITEDMPFLVDSVRMAINRLSITAHLLLHSPIAVKRNKSHMVESLLDTKQEGHGKQTIFLIEVDRQTSKKALQDIEKELHSVLDEVQLAVSDWIPMKDQLKDIIANYDKQPCPAGAQAQKQTHAFLRWISNENFTLMGYRHYQAKAIEGDHRWIADNDSSLGLMKNSVSNRERLLSKLPASAQQETLSENPLILTKTNSKSRVHRPAYMDYIGIKEFDKQGNVIGEHRFIGLYSSAFYNAGAYEVPVLKDKIARMCDNSGFDKSSHAYKAFLNILETYPRDELIQANESELGKIALGIFQMQERGISRLFMRRDVFGRFYSCMVFVPRERYNTQLRKETQALLQKSFNSDQDVEFTTYFSESVYARTHYIVRVKNNNVEINVKEIEKNIIELSKRWEDKLSSALRSTYGEARGKQLDEKYVNAFTRSYKEHNLPTTTVVDIEKIESLTDTHTLDMLFYRPQEESADSEAVKLKLFHRNQPIHLSAVLPMLEHFGLRVIDESPYQVKASDGSVNWIMDFSMLHTASNKMSLEQAQELFQDAFPRSGIRSSRTIPLTVWYWVPDCPAVR